MTDLMRFAGQEGSVASVPQVVSDVTTGEDLVKELEGAVGVQYVVNNAV